MAAARISRLGGRRAFCAQAAGWRPPARVLDALRWSNTLGTIDQRLASESETVAFWRDAQTVTQHEARTLYLLRTVDLAPLPFLLKVGAHSHTVDPTEAHMIPLYFRLDVLRVAAARWGSMETIAKKVQHREIVRTRRLARRQQLFIGTRLKRDNSQSRSAAASSAPVGQQAVYAALVVNALIAAGKAAAYYYTGSGAMFAETVHSCADFFNQVCARTAPRAARTRGVPTRARGAPAHRRAVPRAARRALRRPCSRSA